MSEWQPIETAPKDGQILLFYPPQRGVPARVYVCDDWATVAPTRTYFVPSHWMPLPELP